MVVFDGGRACFSVFRDCLTGNSVKGKAIVLDWTDKSVESFFRPPSNVERECLLDALRVKWCEDSEWATTVS